MPQIGIIADDLTGATTTGVLLARSKARTTVYFEENMLDEEARSCDAVVISSNSRSYSRDKAYDKVKRETLLLKALGTQYYSKRIDTTMRGNIGCEIDAMLDALEEGAIAVVMPAMPQAKRILAGGYSIIDGVVLTDTPAAMDVRTPVRECYIPKLLKEQSVRKIGYVELSIVIEGKDAVKKRLTELKNEGCQIIVADSVSMANIHTVSQSCAELPWKILSVDPGPFTAQLAYVRGIVQKEDMNLPEGLLNMKECEENGKSVLVVCGSATSVTKRQMEVLCQDTRHQRISVDPLALIGKKETIEKVIDSTAKQICSFLERPVPPRAILIETALHGILLNLEEEDRKRNMLNGTCAEKINDGLGKIAARVIESDCVEKIVGIYATGGDTMVNVCRNLGAGKMEVFDYLIPQADIGRIQTTRLKLPIIGKGGLTGADDTAVRIVDRIFMETVRK